MYARPCNKWIESRKKIDQFASGRNEVYHSSFCFLFLYSSLPADFLLPSLLSSFFHFPTLSPHRHYSHLQLNKIIHFNLSAGLNNLSMKHQKATNATATSNGNLAPCNRVFVIPELLEQIAHHLDFDNLEIRTNLSLVCRLWRRYDTLFMLLLPRTWLSLGPHEPLHLKTDLPRFSHASV